MDSDYIIKHTKETSRRVIPGLTASHQTPTGETVTGVLAEHHGCSHFLIFITVHVKYLSIFIWSKMEKACCVL